MNALSHMNTSHLPHLSILIHSRVGAFFLLLPTKCGAGGARGGLGRDGRRRTARERLEYDDEVNGDEGEMKGGRFLPPLPHSLPIAAAAAAVARLDDHSDKFISTKKSHAISPPENQLLKPKKSESRALLNRPSFCESAICESLIAILLASWDQERKENDGLQPQEVEDGDGNKEAIVELQRSNIIGRFGSFTRLLTDPTCCDDGLY
ncbi:hypothetical protein U9M48_006047 [Paspalum notatum var. saurae]|uniref:Uncharacterized protein n=1 Tax=Paspalum notatum var. saurae TaxID=547442 RepID=A0AAQ3SJ29_PASNO